MPRRRRPTSPTSSGKINQYSGTEDDFWPFDKTKKKNASLYEYAGAANKEPFLVGVTGGEYNAGDSERNNELISTCETKLGFELSQNFTPPAQGGNALSADGRTIFFTLTLSSGRDGYEDGASKSPVVELFARVDGEEAGAHTVAISQPDAPQLPANALAATRAHPMKTVPVNV